MFKRIVLGTVVLCTIGLTMAFSQPKTTNIIHNTYHPQVEREIESMQLAYSGVSTKEDKAMIRTLAWNLVRDDDISSLPPNLQNFYKTLEKDAVKQ